MLAWWSFSPIAWIEALTCHLTLFPMTIIFLALSWGFNSFVTPKLTFKGQAVLHGALSAVVTGAGQMVQGRFLVGLSLYLATVCVPVGQGILFVMWTATASSNYPVDASSPWFFIYFLPSYIILWVFGIWDAARRSRLRILTVSALGLILNLVVPGLGTVWATTGNSANLKWKFYWTGVLAVAGGLLWCFFPVFLCFFMLLMGHLYFPVFTSYDLWGYPNGLILYGFIVFILTSLPLFFLEKQQLSPVDGGAERNAEKQ